MMPRKRTAPDADEDVGATTKKTKSTKTQVQVQGQAQMQTQARNLARGSTEGGEEYWEVSISVVTAALYQYHEILGLKDFDRSLRPAGSP